MTSIYNMYLWLMYDSFRVFNIYKTDRNGNGQESFMCHFMKQK